jgi:hypothetical protein
MILCETEVRLGTFIYVEPAKEGHTTCLTNYRLSLNVIDLDVSQSYHSGSTELDADPVLDQGV